MIEAPKILKTKSKIAACIHLKIPRKAIQDEMKPAIDELISVLSDQGNPPIGPMFAHHLTQSSTHFDFEVGFPVVSPISAVGRCDNSELPAATIAQTTYQGPYEGLYAAWEEFGKMLENNEIIQKEGLKRGETLWEVYVLGPETNEDPATWRTDLCLPLVSAVS